jgi:hypothetical protein
MVRETEEWEKEQEEKVGQLWAIKRKTQKKYHTDGTVPKSNRKIVERGKINTPKA